METLNLAGADLSGFDAVPSGPYLCSIFEVTAVTVEKEDGKLPQGTPGYNIQFKCEDQKEDGRYINRRFFQRYYIPNEDYPADKREKLLGMFARFLIAAGYDENTVTSGKFKFDPDELIGREVTVVVGQREYNGEIQNTVRNVKAPAGDLEEAGLI